jgi:hypothetical protein
VQGNDISAMETNPMNCYHRGFYVRDGLLAMAMLCAATGYAQYGQEQGHSIGSVSVRGKLIVLTLDSGVLGESNLFNLSHHTLRFTPDGSQYRVETLPWQWDPTFGPEMTGSKAMLKNFAFPFSANNWNSFSVGVTGSITFGEAKNDAGPSSEGAGRGRDGGISVDRFAELRQAGPTLINTIPAISVFFKPRMSGMRHFKELDDRAVITWSLTEPVGGVQDMTWTPTVNRFQAVLRKDGTIDLSYENVAAKDAIVGIYPMVTGGTEKEIATISAKDTSSAAPALRIKQVKLTAVDGVFLKATIETRGQVLPRSDPAMAGISYRVCLSRTKPTEGCTENAHADILWTILGRRGRRDRGGDAHYRAFGTGVLPKVSIDADSLSAQGTLPEGYKAGERVFVYAAVQTPGTPAVTVDQLTPRTVTLTGLESPAVDLSSMKKQDGPFPVVYEAFHYLKPPRAVDLTCTVIKALGDKFDMLAYYSDFRIDNPEAGTSSDGPLGGGPEGGEVTGIGAKQENLAGYCSKGRFQWQYIQPVYVGANQMQEYPPTGVEETDSHDVTAYTHQLAERTSNGKIPPYDYAMSQIGHEMGHRWSAFVSAKVNGEIIDLGPTHWAMGLQARVPFPYQRPTEASAMGGGVWQDNYNGTYTQLDDNYFVPATGYSYLDLYLMGFISPTEVPDFFILRNLELVAHDSNGHPIYKADRTKVTIQDVIAVEGPRSPTVDHAQKDFNTGMVVVVEHGKTPSPELIDRTNGIRDRWMDYWTTTTGHRSTMTTNP